MKVLVGAFNKKEAFSGQCETSLYSNEHWILDICKVKAQLQLLP